MKSKSFLDAMNDVDPEIVRSAEPGKRKKTIRIVMLAAAAVLLLAAILVPVGFAVNNAAPSAPAKDDRSAARVYLDVNPSFVLDVTKNGKILAVAAANDDAKKVLADNENLTEKDVTVGGLLGAMMKDGYLSGNRDTLLLSVKCADGALAEELKGKLAAEARGFLSEHLPGGHALALSLSENEHADAIAEKYHISRGAAEFLIRLIGCKEEYTEEMLASKDISTLRRLCEENGISMEYSIRFSSGEAIDAARKKMKEELNDEPIDILSVYVDGGEKCFWRTAAVGKENYVIYDFDSMSGAIVEELRRGYVVIDNYALLDAAIDGAGFTKEEIAHYPCLKTKEWSWLYVTVPSPANESYVRLLPLDLSSLSDESTPSAIILYAPLVLCQVNLHTTDGRFLSVNINRLTGEVVSVRDSSYTYAIDTLDAVIIAMEDAGLQYRIAPPYPENCVISEGVCDLVFVYDGQKYDYRIDVYTGEILSKQMTPIAE